MKAITLPLRFFRRAGASAASLLTGTLPATAAATCTTTSATAAASAITIVVQALGFPAADVAQPGSLTIPQRSRLLANVLVVLFLSCACQASASLHATAPGPVTVVDTGTFQIVTAVTGTGTAGAVTTAVTAAPTVKASGIIRLVTSAALEIAGALLPLFSRKLGHVDADSTALMVRRYLFAPVRPFLASALIVPNKAFAASPCSIFINHGTHRDSPRCAQPWSTATSTARSPAATRCAHSAAHPTPTRTCGVARHNLAHFGTRILAL